MGTFWLTVLEILSSLVSFTIFGDTFLSQSARSVPVLLLFFDATFELLAGTKMELVRPVIWAVNFWIYIYRWEPLQDKRLLLGAFIQISAGRTEIVAISYIPQTQNICADLDEDQSLSIAHPTLYYWTAFMWFLCSNNLSTNDLPNKSCSVSSKTMNNIFRLLEKPGNGFMNSEGPIWILLSWVKTTIPILLSRMQCRVMEL